MKLVCIRGLLMLNHVRKIGLREWYQRILFKGTDWITLFDDLIFADREIALKRIPYSG